MMGTFWNWIDDRTGLGRVTREALYENIPGGSRWRYITGSMLVFAFVTQAITGLFLWMCYSPGSQNAYESVFWIQNELQGGWVLRGIHHFMAHAMVVLLPLHFLQVVIDRAYIPPREFNFWLGLILMLITLALSLTGYLLPWDQKGYWATKVATNLMALAPGGESLQRLVVGGADYGHYTLTRFFALHAGLLPALFIFVLFLHITLFRKHGITAQSSPHRPDQYFWPYQVLKDGVGCLVLLAIVLLVVFWQRGAELGPPADPVEAFEAARPEWYFLFLFQFLKKFEEAEFFGAIVAPALVVGFMFLMPLIGRWRIGHALNVVVLLVLIGGTVYLTGEALLDDNRAAWFEYAPEKHADDEEALATYEDRFVASRGYLAAVEQAHQEYQRVRELVRYHGIPREGVTTLMRDDPELQGPRLFAAKCAGCHSYLDSEGQGIAGPAAAEDGEPNGAPNLYQFASRGWIRGLLDHERITTDQYFGNTAHQYGEMADFVESMLSDLDEEGLEALDELAVALSAEAGLVYQEVVDREAEASGAIERGREALVDRFSCIDCHKFHDEGYEGLAPDLTGYGSLEWLKLMIANPEHERMYGGNNDRMPAFAAHEEEPHLNELSPKQLDLLARWIRQDDRILIAPDEPMAAADEQVPPGDDVEDAGELDEVAPEATPEEVTDEPPADEPAADESPEEAPADEPSTDEPPEEAPADEPATDESPEEAPADEPPTDESPEEAPADEPPTEEAPAAETSEEESTDDSPEEPEDETPEEPASEDPSPEDPSPQDEASTTTDMDTQEP
jgi:ubiquinol-cytochrome c reductase cytochrome b subunit